MMCKPAMTCCCGIPLRLGGLMILLLHAAINAAILIPAVSHIMMPGFDSGVLSLSGDVIVAAASFSGVPFILLGLWAVLYKDDRYWRAYYYYLILVSVIGTCFFISSAFTNSCVNSLPKELMRGGANGGSLFCTIFNVGSKLLMLALASVLAYFTFIIWSLDASFFFDGNSLRDLGMVEIGCCGTLAGICGCGACCGLSAGLELGCCGTLAGICGCGACCGGDFRVSCEACCGGCGDECGSFCAGCGCEACDCCSGSKSEKMPFAGTSDAAPNAPNAKTLFGAPGYPHVISYPNLETIARGKTWEVPQMSMP
eukprot:TRINITY_DN2215_c0_g1_i2.p1 TRINITY_DN2215_c0_g1~~TRINITY_DN2215_c0_g1_i2.p1  ORF type:complete len:312 (-),score=36.31 TRINITY_DN2215_c0_g1_i2:94-1029(-)